VGRTERGVGGEGIPLPLSKHYITTTIANIDDFERFKHYNGALHGAAKHYKPEDEGVWDWG
jgi:hypothetical protein